MIKYVLGTGIGLLISSLVGAQNSDFPADSSEKTSVVFLFSEEISFGYALPEEGDIVAHINETILYNTTVKRHRLHGNWQSWYPNKQLCDSGSFVKGMPNGEWKHWNADGRLLAIRNYNADKLVRVKNEIRRNNPKNTVYPLVKLYNKNSRLAKKYMRAAYSFGYSSINIPQRSLQQAVENNIAPGAAYFPVFNECLHHGLYMNFYEDGEIKDSGYYKNGLREGLWLHREADGSSISGIYRNGMKYSDWKQYDAVGNLTTIVVYNKKGEEEWRKKIGR